MSDAYQAMIGLPRSGKTTFLAALWHLIDAGEVSTKLVLDELVGDHSYLNSIVDSWRRCEEVPRTSMAAETQVEIHIHEPSTGRKWILEFPDLSGESFERQIATRRCRSLYVKNCDKASGIMLFVTANRPNDGMTILDLAPMLDGSAENDVAHVAQEWTVKMMPEQVRIVELLQFLQHQPFARRKRKLAILISAWDVITSPQLTPGEWLHREMPLLHQLLLANSMMFDYCFYGISAQGGDLGTGNRDALLRRTPSERIMCVGHDGRTSHDLTEPIVWLMTESPDAPSNRQG